MTDKLLSDDELKIEIGKCIHFEDYDAMLDLINTQKHLAYSQGVNDALFDPTGKSNAEIAARNKRLYETKGENQ